MLYFKGMDETCHFVLLQTSASRLPGGGMAEKQGNAVTVKGKKSTGKGAAAVSGSRTTGTGGADGRSSSRSASGGDDKARNRGSPLGYFVVLLACATLMCYCLRLLDIYFMCCPSCLTCPYVTAAAGEEAGPAVAVLSFHP